MEFFVAITDKHWYDFLRQLEPEDVNFWQPGGRIRFRAIATGYPFLFKLKSPFNVIAGLGFFSSHTFLPINIAWEVFGEKNGASSYEEFRENIIRLRGRDSLSLNPNIGCIVLTNPIFFNEEDWISMPSDWNRNIQTGKTYNTNDIIGAKLWSDIEVMINRYVKNTTIGEKSQLIREPDLSSEYRAILKRIRLGQEAFRVLVTDAYNRRCAISGERILPALEASHIKPYSDSGPNFISNSLLLRADIHKLFDSGYLTITPSFHVEVSRKIREEFENGAEYYKFHGKQITNLPARDLDKPSPKYINWHNDIFRV